MERNTQEIIINQLINSINEFDEDLIIKLQDAISKSLSEDNKESKFIELYELAQNKLDNLIAYQTECTYDIWEFFWNRLFGNNGLVHKAYKLVPFNTDIIDSSYQDEVYWIMSNWEDAVKAIKKRREQDNYFNNL